MIVSQSGNLLERSYQTEMMSLGEVFVWQGSRSLLLLVSSHHLEEAEAEYEEQYLVLEWQDLFLLHCAYVTPAQALYLRGER